MLTLELPPPQKLEISLTGDDGRNDRVFSARLYRLRRRRTRV